MSPIIKRTGFYYKDIKCHSEWSKGTEDSQVKGTFTSGNRETEGIRKLSRSQKSLKQMYDTFLQKSSNKSTKPVLKNVLI